MRGVLRFPARNRGFVRLHLWECRPCFDHILPPDPSLWFFVQKVGQGWSRSERGRHRKESGSIEPVEELSQLSQRASVMDLLKYFGSYGLCGFI